jgi:electron transport complex protein RnfG
MNNRFLMLVMLTVLAVICASALAMVDHVTAPIIALKNEIAYKQIVLEIFGIPCPANDGQAILAAYAENVEEREVNGLPAFVEKSSGKSAISVEGGGFQGPIRVIVALDKTTVTGFRVVSQTETPGLGTRITEVPFQQAFIGKDVANGLRMIKSGIAGNSEFDAITGATETCRALERLLNRGFERYLKGN